MSLLLDALNRASQDKAAAAAAQGQAAATPEPTAQALPVLSGEPERVTGSGAPAMAAPDRPELTLALTEPPALPPAPRPADAWATEQAVATPSPAAHNPAPISVAVPVPTPMSGGATPAGAPATATSGQTVQPAVASSLGARVAQDIVRAKDVAPRAKPRKRVWVMGSLAGVLAVGIGSVLMGWWGDPTAWLQSGGVQGVSLSTPPPAARVTLPGAAAGAIGAVTASSEGAQPAATGPSVASVTTTGSVASSVEPAATASPVPLAQRKAPVRSATRAPAADDGSCEPGGDSPGCSPVRSAQSGGQPVQSKAPAPVFQSRSASPSALEQGYHALTQGKLAEASQIYGRVLASNPQERDALLGMAYIAHSQGRPEEARSYYQQVLRQEPGNPVARSGLLSLGASDDREAIAGRARDVAEQHPASAAAQAALGHAMVRVGRLADAQVAFQRAHALEPTVAQHAFNLAVALDRLRNHGIALQYYERALALAAPSGADRAGAVPLAAVRARINELRAEGRADRELAP